MDITKLTLDDVAQIWHISDIVFTDDYDYVHPSYDTRTEVGPEHEHLEVAMLNNGIDDSIMEGDAIPVGSKKFTLEIYVADVWQCDFDFYLTPDNEFICDTDTFDKEYSELIASWHLGEIPMDKEKASTDIDR